MTSRELAGIHHVKIPVTDLARSLHWYRRVFGLRPTLAFPDVDGVVRGFAGEIPGLKPATVAFRVNPAAAEGSRGFDPVSFAVESRDDLQRRGTRSTWSPTCCWSQAWPVHRQQRRPRPARPDRAELGICRPCTVHARRRPGFRQRPRGSNAASGQRSADRNRHAAHRRCRHPHPPLGRLAAPRAAAVRHRPVSPLNCPGSSPPATQRRCTTSSRARGRHGWSCSPHYGHNPAGQPSARPPCP
jgi:catechol 2,3-dioxygenase-like lactoylglutathione lyase family enzyme